MHRLVLNKSSLVALLVVGRLREVYGIRSVGDRPFHISPSNLEIIPAAIAGFSALISARFSDAKNMKAFRAFFGPGGKFAACVRSCNT